MISVDGSLFIQIANFLLLIFLMNKILYAPIRKILSQRKKRMDGLENDIKTFSEGAHQKDDAYRVGIRNARAEGLNEKNRMIQEAEAEEKAVIQKINEKAQAEMTAIREKIARDADVVRSDLMKQVETFGNNITEKILGRAV